MSLTEKPYTLWVKDNNITTMQIPLIQGQFHKNDAIALMSELIQTKIKFHESRIAHASK
jgi:hypothetical protein